MTVAEAQAHQGRQITGRETAPKYRQDVVEQVLLEAAVRAYRAHPQPLKIDALISAIVWNSSDAREVETAARAIRGLHEAGLFSYGDGDQFVAPTRAALRAHKLLLMR